ncbi:MAG: FAD:protein FMN transferase [Candidatus Levybacteria bacterium]|nr:FAD:protein FMN transferase [Candidatus Levybacteria bacterium]
MQGSSLFFEAIGTTWHITTDIPISLIVQKEIQDRIAYFDRTYSRFRDDSIITKIAQKKGIYRMPSDAKDLFALYRTLYTVTQGSFTPLIGQLLSDAGYDRVYSLEQKRVSSVPQWDEVMEYKTSDIIVKKPILLDFGAAGKGYLVDLVGEVLKKHKEDSFCINAGGDILYQTKLDKKLRVGLENPLDTKQVIGIAEIKEGSICGSAGNRRKWGSFHHIMNPHTQKSTDHILATWVVAKSGLIADGLATALFFADPMRLTKEFDFAYVILKNDNSIEKSANFPGEIYLSS